MMSVFKSRDRRPATVVLEDVEQPLTALAPFANRSILAKSGIRGDDGSSTSRRPWWSGHRHSDPCPLAKNGRPPRSDTRRPPDAAGTSATGRSTRYPIQPKRPSRRYRWHPKFKVEYLRLLGSPLGVSNLSGWLSNPNCTYARRSKAPTGGGYSTSGQHLASLSGWRRIVPWSEGHQKAARGALARRSFELRLHSEAHLHIRREQTQLCSHGPVFDKCLLPPRRPWCFPPSIWALGFGFHRRRATFQGMQRLVGTDGDVAGPGALLRLL